MPETKLKTSTQPFWKVLGVMKPSKNQWDWMTVCQSSTTALLINNPVNLISLVGLGWLTWIWIYYILGHEYWFHTVSTVTCFNMLVAHIMLLWVTEMKTYKISPQNFDICLRPPDITTHLHTTRSLKAVRAIEVKKSVSSICPPDAIVHDESPRSFLPNFAYCNQSKRQFCSHIFISCKIWEQN